MIINYHLTKEDVIAFQKDSFRRLKVHQIGQIIFLILFMVYAFLRGLIFSAYLLEPILEFVSFGLFRVFMVIGSILFVALLMPIIKRAYGFIMISVFRLIIRNDKRLPKDVTLNFHESGIDVHSVNHVMKRDTHVPWDSIENIGEDSKRLFLYFKDVKEGIIIPISSSLLKESDQQTLRDLLKQHLNPEFIREDSGARQFLN